MRALAALFLIGVIGLAVVLCVQNDEGITLTLFAWSLVTPLWVLAAVGYVLGMFSGWAIAGFLKRSWQRVTEPRPR